MAHRAAPVLESRGRQSGCARVPCAWKPKSGGGWRIPESARQRFGGRNVSAQAMADRGVSANGDAASVGAPRYLMGIHLRGAYSGSSASALLGLLSGSTVVLFGVTLWVLYGSPIHPRSASVHTPGVRIAAGRGEPLGGVGPIEVTGASRRDLAREPGAQAGAQDRPVAEAMIPPAAPSDQSGSSSVNAAEQRGEGDAD